MSPRHYRSPRRKAATEETRRRIVDSTVELHAEHGVIATTYVMIAKHADVAVPTVYNHFPTRGDLLQACTGQAEEHAPAIGPQIYDDIGEDVDARLAALVHALFAQYRYFAPWMRWAIAEQRQVPELAEWLSCVATLRRRLIGLALAPAFPASPPPTPLALCDALLDFPAWQRLSDEPDLTPMAAEAALADALAALVARHRDTPPNNRKRK